MTKRMLIDATHPEETRVAVINGNRLEEYDYETLVRKQLKSNIYLVKVTRVEPSLQAAFVDFGGNRHGFLPFPEIHPDYYRIPIADREALIAEERALAAAQAAREEEEDAAELAELAAQGESIDDLDDEDEDGDSDVEDYIPQHTGSIAEDMAQATATDDSDDDEDDDNEEEEAEDEDDNAPAFEAISIADLEAAQNGENDDQDDKDDEDEEEAAVDTVGGDVIDTPVFRSSIKRKYKIQEVIKRNQIMLIQIGKEERGNKGAAVTSYISLPGRYCVLMPNSPRGGGVSRKVSNAKDRHRLKKILHELNVPEGMSVILRTAGVARTKAEIKRDLDYLLRLWDQIRELTLKSTAPALIYEEGNLIKRAIRDLYRRDIAEVQVAGEQGYKTAYDFMKTLMPSHAERIHQYQDDTMPLFYRHQVEKQIDEIHNPTVHLKSGGYIVINPTEAMVSIDVNSGRATKGRHIEETALKTNLEAAEEIARQLRLRDQGGLVVIDFIDMEDRRGNRTVEKRLRDAMQTDRARIQLGRISAFGLLELSRQRLHPSLVESNFETCKHCNGTGLTRTVETAAVIILRAIEEEGIKARSSEIRVSVSGDIALYIFNHKREMLAAIEKRHNIRVFLHADDSLIKPAYNIESVRASSDRGDRRPQHRHAPVQTVDMSDLPELTAEEISDDSTVADDDRFDSGDDEAGDDRGNRGHGGDRGGRDDRGGRNRRNGGRNRRGGERGGNRDDRGGNRGNRGGERRQQVVAEGEQPADDAFDRHLQPQDGQQPAARHDGAEQQPRAPRAEGERREDGDGRERRGRRRRGGRNRNRRNGEGNRAEGTPGQDGAQGNRDNNNSRNVQGFTPREDSPRNDAPQAKPEGESRSGNTGGEGQQDNAGGEGRKGGWWKRLTE
jgi:ribonuclease E